MDIIVGSENPVKLGAVQMGFARVFASESFTIQSISINTDISKQPQGDAETLRGALVRATKAHETRPDADYAVGLEGGIEDGGDEMSAFAWIVVIAKDGRIGKGRTATFFLPREVARLVRSGIELGKANDSFFGVENSKHDLGAGGLLTKGVLKRPEYYSQAVILALIPHINQNMQFGTET